jgi:hypothetical protein
LARAVHCMGEVSARKPDGYDTVRRLKILQHRDHSGLRGLMDDYMALGDELELDDAPDHQDTVVPDPPRRPSRAA